MTGMTGVCLPGHNGRLLHALVAAETAAETRRLVASSRVAVLCWRALGLCDNEFFRWAALGRAALVALIHVCGFVRGI